MSQSPLYEFLKEDDETPEEAVDRRLAWVISDARKKAIAFLEKHRGVGNCRSTDLAKIDATLEQLRMAQRETMLAQIEAHDHQTQ